MKLYATVTSERNSRPAKKGGDEWLSIELWGGNKHLTTLMLRHAERGWEEVEGTHVLEWQQDETDKNLIFVRGI